ncbi:hypothetical protein MUP32_03070 [Candidatus Microgenomates bacterium]|nr:hypothetical protein [Candidatus Microgenomates bacterium]
MKKILGAAVGVGMLLAAVVPTFAASNIMTGPDSINVNATLNLKLFSVTNTNFAFVTNDVVSVSNSGGNSANGNTMGGAVVSGGSQSYTVISNNVNHNYTRIRM